MLPEPLFSMDDTPRVRLLDPVTSHEAADASQAGLSKLQAIVLAIFAERGQLTDSELDDYYFNVAHDRDYPMVRLETPRRRRSDLTKKALIKSTGETRKNPFNRSEIVWSLA